MKTGNQAQSFLIGLMMISSAAAHAQEAATVRTHTYVDAFYTDEYPVAEGNRFLAVDKLVHPVALQQDDAVAESPGSSAPVKELFKTEEPAFPDTRESGVGSASYDEALVPAPVLRQRSCRPY